MSRGGRGRGRRGGFGAGNLPPMGLTFADIQNMSREQTELYPEIDPLPALTAPTEEEKKICALQKGFVDRLRASKYYLVEVTKTDELPRYSDKYRPSPAAQPTLKRKDLHQPFFPQEIFEDYFNPRRKGRGKGKKSLSGTKNVKLDEIAATTGGDEEQEPTSDKPSEAGSEVEEDEGEDDVEDELGENDYVEDYFDNGEGDDLDDLGDGGGGGDTGGDYD